MVGGDVNSKYKESGQRAQRRKWGRCEGMECGVGREEAMQCVAVAAAGVITECLAVDKEKLAEARAAHWLLCSRDWPVGWRMQAQG